MNGLIFLQCPSEGRSLHSMKPTELGYLLVNLTLHCTDSWETQNSELSRHWQYDLGQLIIFYHVDFQFEIPTQQDQALPISQTLRMAPPVPSIKYCHTLVPLYIKHVCFWSKCFELLTESLSTWSQILSLQLQPFKRRSCFHSLLYNTCWTSGSSRSYCLLRVSRYSSLRKLTWSSWEP